MGLNRRLELVDMSYVLFPNLIVTYHDAFCP